jgi:hypothetical protein
MATDIIDEDDETDNMDGMFYFYFTIDHARLRPRKLPKEVRNAQDGSDELL